MPDADPVASLVAQLDLEKYKATIKGLTRFGDRRQGTDRNRAALDWIAPDESLGHLAQARWLTATIPAERVGMRVDSLLGMVDAVKHGCGLGMLLCVLAERERDLVRLAPPDAGLDTRVFVLTHRDLRKVQRIKALTYHLYDKLRKNRFLIQSRV